MSNYVFRGIYASYIEQFIAVKRNIGYKYNTEEHYLKRFDRLTMKQAETEIGISRELSEAWCERSKSESDSSWYHRCLCLRQLSSFLCGMGIRSYIPNLRRPNRSSFIPRIFSSAEIAALFNAIDNLRMPNRNMRSSLFAMPTLFRLLYGTGLRIGEALSLVNHDVDLEAGVIVIKDSKNGKQRMIPVSASLLSVLQDYVDRRGKLPVMQSGHHPFFISLNGSICRQDCTYDYFRKALKVVGIPFEGNGHGPRVHDLRHTFAVHSLKGMAEACIDLYSSLPILSVYMGHMSYSSTNSYLRMVLDMYPGLIRDVGMVCFNVFPKVESYEAD